MLTILATISDSEFLWGKTGLHCDRECFFSPSFALFFFKVMLQFRVHWTRGCAAIRKEGLQEASADSDYTACLLVLSLTHSCPLPFIPQVKHLQTTCQ